MKESFIKDLTEQIITREDFIILFEEISLAEKLIFKDANVPLSEKLKGKARDQFVNLVEKLEKEDPHFLMPNRQLSFFQNLKKELKKINQIKMELAFQPSTQFLLKIKQWFKEKNKLPVVFDLWINPEIVGGITIEFQGKYRNFSLAKRIDDLFSKKIL